MVKKKEKLRRVDCCRMVKSKRLIVEASGTRGRISGIMTYAKSMQVINKTKHLKSFKG